MRTIKRPIGLRSHVLVQSWQGRLWAYVNGEPVVADYVPEWTVPRKPEALVGFGAYVDDNRFSVRYRNVHLLAAEPKPPNPLPSTR